jgi:hypothetical protein
LQPIAVFKKFVDTCEHSKKAGPSTPFAAKSAANFAQDDSGIQVAANLMMTAVFMSWQRV